MARVRGIMKILGHLDGISIYEMKGKLVARRVNGHSKDRILKDPSFKRMRENMSEFGAASHIGKVIRTGLGAVIKQMSDSYVSGRLNKAMKTVISNGNGKRGQRDFQLLPNKGLLEGFEFNADTHFGDVFHAPFELAANSQRNEVTLTVPDFDTGKQIATPSSATHFRLVLAIVALSDYTFNTNWKKYGATVPALNELGAFQVSAEIQLRGMVGATTALNPQLPGGPNLTANVGLVACVGIEFLQELNGVFYLLAQGNAMKVVEVF